MVYLGVTSLLNDNVPNNVYNGKTLIGYRVRTCDTNLNSNTPANQYQRLKVIWKTVRTYASMYTMNLQALTAYENPSNKFQRIFVNGSSYYTASPGVYWNQMSDRAYPHTQTTITPSGSTYHGSSTKRSIVRNRPGCLSPGGSGCDIKHNSYDRYLNRLKGKAPLRRGVIPPNFGSPIPYNRAYPIRGGKTTKPNIVSGCDCDSKAAIALIYKDPNYNDTYLENHQLRRGVVPSTFGDTFVNGKVVDPNIINEYNTDSKVVNALLYEDTNYKINNVFYQFSIGEKVYVYNNNVKVVAEILAINGINYTLKLPNDIIAIFHVQDLLFYHPTKCNYTENKIITDLESTCILPETELFFP
jgi:hypothetical protein